MSCYANPDPTFQPAMRLISSISQAFPATVTTTFDHDYQTGYIVRFEIPPRFGMQQIDQKQAVITVTGSTTFTVDIDTTNFDAYAPSGDYPYSFQCGQIIPIANVNNSIYLATENVLT